MFLGALGDMFVYNMGDSKPRYIVRQVRLDGEKRALTVAIFPLDMSEAEARQLHSTEMAHAGGLQLRKGIKQKAERKKRKEFDVHSGSWALSCVMKEKQWVAWKEALHDNKARTCVSACA